MKVSAQGLSFGVGVPFFTSGTAVEGAAEQRHIFFRKR